MPAPLLSRVAWVDGRYVGHADAYAVHVEDRGYQFADGVYEVIHVEDGRLVDEGPHLDRLDRSLGELAIPAPMARRPLQRVLREVARRNGVAHGLVYLQVTRGIARRRHAFPADARPVMVVTARSEPGPEPSLLEEGVAVVTLPDQRWARCDIKSVALLANVLAKQAAAAAGAAEAWLVDRDGMVTEGGSSNAWIVTTDGRLVTRPADNAILDGITRRTLLALAAGQGLTVDLRGFSPEEARGAREAFFSNSSSWVMPVTRIDDAVVANGRAGSLSRALNAAYLERLGGLPRMAAGLPPVAGGTR
ncbi:MAG: D-amino-acid transaminase [Alphaproteobacteria bacterium]